MEMNSLPKGYRFNPTGKEIMDLLRLKMVDHDSSVESLIPEIDVLEFEPWEILRMLSRSSNDKECHFFAPRKRKYPRSDRADRCTRAGQWKPTGNRPKISTLGIKRRLTFYLGRPHAMKTDYIMHQYELNDMKEFALCWLKRNKDAKSEKQDINSNTSCVEDSVVEDTGPAQKGSQQSLVQPFQMVEQEANQELFVPPLQLYGEIDYADRSLADQSVLHDQIIQQESNQELLFSQLEMCDDIDYASLRSLKQVELYDHYQLPDEEANQEMFVPPLSMSDDTDYTSLEYLKQSELYDHSQLPDEEANQEMFVPPLSMSDDTDYTSLGSLEPSELYDQLHDQEANQEMLVPPLSMSDDIDYTSLGSLEQSELYDQLHDQEANQEMLVQPSRMHGCIDSSSPSSFEQGELSEDFDHLIASFINGFQPESPMGSVASFINGFQPESPMGSGISNETLLTELAIDESQVITGGLQAPAVV